MRNSFLLGSCLITLPLLLLVTNSFLWPTLLSSIFLYVLLSVCHNIGISSLLSVLPPECIFVLSSLLTLLQLSILYFLVFSFLLSLVPPLLLLPFYLSPIHSWSSPLDHFPLLMFLFFLSTPAWLIPGLGYCFPSLPANLVFYSAHLLFPCSSLECA